MLWKSNKCTGPWYSCKQISVGFWQHEDPNDGQRLLHNWYGGWSNPLQQNIINNHARALHGKAEGRTWASAENGTDQNSSGRWKKWLATPNCSCIKEGRQHLAVHRHEDVEKVCQETWKSSTITVGSCQNNPDGMPTFHDLRCFQGLSGQAQSGV